MNITRLIKTSLLLLIGFASVNAQTHWESIVLESDTWKYLPATSEPTNTWSQPGFNDAAWKSGVGGLGYSDNDDATTVTSCNSLYIRTQLTLTDVSTVKNLLLDIDYDDAFILYINGVECTRSSNIVGSFPAYNAALTIDHEAKMYSGGSPERFQLKPSSLIKGTNVFALHILNQNLNSKDLSARVFVHAQIDGTAVLFHATPTWFVPPIASDSNLPIIFVSTNGQNILQNTKIMADMKVLNSASGFNLFNDTTYEYNNKVGIEIRGFTSSGFPKKSYTVETRNPDSTNLNASLLGMPKENDWVFHGPYPDKSLMRNALMYNLGNTTGKWSSRTRFFELYINGNYNGVYTLAEKIKNDKNRLNLADLNPVDTIGDELTGGYILKLDRPETTDVDGINYWVSPYRAATTLQQKEYFLFVDPEGENIVQQQRDYIRKYITDFEDAMYSDNYNDRAAGYYPYVDLQSFADYYILTELARNLDGYRISTFLHKDKDSKGGKITMGPFWDYDICLGNANFFSAGNTAGWVIDGMGNGDGYAMPFWWQKLRLDPYFNSVLKQRWNVLKNKSINTDYIYKVIDSCAYDLRDAQARNFTKWNILSTYVWPNNYVSGSYANEITYLKTWLSDRMLWMDTQIQAIAEIPQGLHTTNDMIMDLVTYPNPFADKVNFKYYIAQGGKFEIIINDMLGRQVLHYNETVEPGIYTIPLTISKTNPSNVYVYQIFVDGKYRMAGKLVRQ